MTLLYVAMEDRLLTVRGRDGRWDVETGLEGLPLACVAADPLAPERVFCGTFERGLWRSDDAGATWRSIGDGLPHRFVLAVTVSTQERSGAEGVLWAGTEPSALFRSEDGGSTWQERPALRELPSAPTWSFPPKPWTHHVRSIALHPDDPRHVYVAIELGGVMRSLDGGLTWEDRKPGGPMDAHQLATHRLAPDRVYAAAGDGYFESADGGSTWRRLCAGLHHSYAWSVAVDPADPTSVVVSSASGPYQAHNVNACESFVYQKSGADGWQASHAGLPGPTGALVFDLAASVTEPGVFYAVTNTSLYRSSDGGRHWEPLDLPWPETFHRQHAHGLVAATL